MSEIRSIAGDALDPPDIATPQSGHLQSVERSEELPEPLEVIRIALQSVEAAHERFPGYRLTRLVGARLELSEFDAARLSGILGADLLPPPQAGLHPFNDHLRYLIARYDLKSLFKDDGPAPHHHSIRPTGYDYYRDEVDPIGMERWRARYRGMSDERQMLAASIIWLYRAGKDKIWLRRVPCTWHAADAIVYMKSTNVLFDWGRLFVLYPGW